LHEFVLPGLIALLLGGWFWFFQKPKDSAALRNIIVP